MSTGPIESWSVNPQDIGPVYPFAGWEVLMFVTCVAFCLAFLVWKFMTESAKYAAESEHLRESQELQRRLGVSLVDQSSKDEEALIGSTADGGP